jgi:hypothetical protein
MRFSRLARISFPVVCAFRLREEREIHGISDGLHTRVIRMQMVASIIGRQVPRGVCRIVSGSVLVHDSIASAGFAPEKGIDLLSRGFSRRSPIVSSLIRR